MGWDFSHREPGMTTRLFFDREFSHGTEDALTEFVGTAMVGTTFYAALRTISTGEVCALVCLTHRERGYYNFGYKDMDESMGPGEAQMPAKLLDLLTLTDSQWAGEWRARCRRNAERAALAKTLKAGDTLKINGLPLHFEGYRPVRQLTVVDLKRRRFVATTDTGVTFTCRLGTDWASRYSWEKTS